MGMFDDLRCKYPLPVEGAKIIDVRGWGHLTGQGAHGLPDANAEAIQDNIGDSLAQLLNRYW